MGRGQVLVPPYPSTQSTQAMETNYVVQENRWHPLPPHWPSVPDVGREEAGLGMIALILIPVGPLCVMAAALLLSPLVEAYRA